MSTGLLSRGVVIAAVVATMSSGPRPAPVDLAIFQGASLVRPAGYDEWPLVGASLGLSYSPGAVGGAHQMFHRVYVNPTSYRTFLSSRKFPEGTTFVLELYEPVDQLALPARAGKYEGRRTAVEASVKDTKRFGGWAYFSFDNGRARTATAFDRSRCQSCHIGHAATDSVFTQFYPRFRDRSQ